MATFITKTSLGIFTLAGMWIAFSCQDDMVSERKPLPGDAIAFTLVDDSTWSSRSAGEASCRENLRFLDTIGNDSLFLHTEVEDNDTSVGVASATSRGLPHSMDGANPSFYLTAFVEDGSPFMKNQYVEKDGENWKYTPLKYWPQAQKVHFYGFTRTKVGDKVYPAGLEYTKAGDGFQGTFSHTLPHPDKTVMKDAEVQPDLVFAMTSGQSKQSIDGAVQLNFRHALSAICFKIGKMPEGTVMQSVSIAGVKPEGNCTMIPDGNGGIDFEWTSGNDAVATTYTQTFGVEKQNDNQLISADGTTFMMIPQVLTEASELIIRFKVKDNEYEFSHPLIVRNDKGEVISDRWMADKKYTYAISTVEKVEVEVEESFTQGANVKNDVRFKNTGLSPAYMRAAIIGYWVNEQGDIITGWKDTDDNVKAEDKVGIFEGFNDKWFKGSDGFYYHKAVVDVGDYTGFLFTKYELVKNPPIAGSSLELNIVVQAVKASDVASAWTNIEVENDVLTEKQ